MMNVHAKVSIWSLTLYYCSHVLRLAKLLYVNNAEVKQAAAPAYIHYLPKTKQTRVMKEHVQYLLLSMYILQASKLSCAVDELCSGIRSGGLNSVNIHGSILTVLHGPEG